MPLFSFEGKSPKIHPTAFIAPTAVIVGDVTIEERGSVWYNAVLRGKRPQMPPPAFIAPPAVIVGDVTIEERASVWYNAVLRGDFNPIVVRRGANVQDCAVVHVTPRGGTEIGAGSTVGHNCTIHAASLGEECLIGNGATVLDGARIGARAMVAAGALEHGRAVADQAFLAEIGRAHV